jgi:transcriptional regulator with XRE-family HTH domain
MEGLHESWGKRLRQRREALYEETNHNPLYTQAGLADACGIRQSTLSRIEAGQCPSDSLKWKLAGALGMTVEDLFPYPAIRPPFPVKAVAS